MDLWTCAESSLSYSIVKSTQHIRYQYILLHNKLFQAFVFLISPEGSRFIKKEEPSCPINIGRTELKTSQQPTQETLARRPDHLHKDTHGTEKKNIVEVVAECHLSSPLHEPFVMNAPHYSHILGINESEDTRR